MDEVKREGVYGTPPAELVSPAEDAIQFSPLIPGAETLDLWGEATLGGMVVLAPPGTIERRYTLALALKALAPGARLTVLAPKDKGGSRLGKELARFGCVVTETARRHYRICVCERPATLAGLEEALAEGRMRLVETLGLWSQPGVFSWNRIDPGSALLARELPVLSGRGADIGCGIGYLALGILKSPKVERLTLIDIDRRAVEAARRNLDDPRVTVRWDDVRKSGTQLTGLDFVVMNPPFHDGGAEDQALGQSFIRRAAEALRPSGVCWLIANRHLPYEAVLKSHFKRAALKVEAEGYKLYEAHR
ncbi:class I SAM-dependent methyltransferase [Microvirga alba]|uniref:class I SAM-dependent methyltransferase n=1 Tax=Microvirga alba TaxID=2791025 RepID=UPI0038995DD0